MVGYNQYNKKYHSEKERQQAKNESLKRYWLNNPEKHTEASRKDYEKHRDQKLQSVALWQINNREKTREKALRWYYKHKAKRNLLLL